MKRHPKFFAVLIIFGVAFLTFIAGLVLAFFVGEFTGSGLLGICGPYGPGLGAMNTIVMSSIPLGVFAGIFSARYFYRKAKYEHKI